MKILRVDLKAYGPFTEFGLDLEGGSQGLHIVYGDNEAGKSTALRALRALLYGIDTTTTDNFLHANDKLRIGGLVRGTAGEMCFVRRKGNKNTLLDEKGQSIGDDALVPFLGGVGREEFFGAWAIDLDDLTTGSKQLLAGQGEVGQALFAAAFSGLRLEGARTGLTDEADRLFRPRGRNQDVNRGLGEYDALIRQCNTAAVSAEAWLRFQRELEQKRQRREELIEQMGALRRREAQLERLQATLPVLAELQRVVVRRLEEMGDVPPLPDDFHDGRLGASEGLRQAWDELRRLGRERMQLKRMIMDLNTPVTLLDHEDAIMSLHQRLGAVVKAQEDKPGLCDQLANTRKDERDLFAGLPPEVAPDAVKADRVDLRASVDALTSEYRQALGRIETARGRVGECEEALRQLGLDPTDEHAGRDASKLQKARDRASAKGDAEDALAKLDRDAKTVGGQCSSALDALGLWKGTLEEMERLPVPVDATLARFDRDLRASHKRLEEATAAVAGLDKQIDDETDKLTATSLSGNVPTEEQLAEARGSRDQGWRLIRRAWLEEEDVTEEARLYDPSNDLPSAYEKRVQRADVTADGMLKEADQIARRKDLRERLDRLAADRSPAAEELETARGEDDALLSDWRAAWAPAEIEPLSPDEMQDWVVRRRGILDRLEDLRRAQSDAEGLREWIAQQRQELSACLEELGEPAAVATETLAALLDRAGSLVAGVHDEDRRWEDLGKARQGLGALQANLEQWEVRWAEAASATGLPQGTMPEQASAILTTLDKAKSLGRDALKFEERLKGIERDEAAFRADARSLADATAPWMKDLPAEDAVSGLVAALRRAADVRKAQQDLGGSARVIAGQATAVRQHKRQLRKLCGVAGCDRPAELEDVERRSLEHRGLTERRSALEEQLAMLNPGKSLEEVATEASGYDVDALPAEILETQARIDELDADRNAVAEAIGAMEKEMEASMSGGDVAAQAAAQGQEKLAEIRDAAERYLVLYLAKHALEQQIQEYRTSQHSPVLDRASKIFSRLACGAFAGIVTDFAENDTQIFVGVRPGPGGGEEGERVSVKDMSAGTRDQLYLALRLAMLDQQLSVGDFEPLPFIVDDILIRFDDHRAAEALRELANISEKTQVIFFTHHRRLVELAKDPQLTGKVFVHALAPCKWEQQHRP